MTEIEIQQDGLLNLADYNRKGEIDRAQAYLEANY
jgi:hypothetical protein